MYNKYAIYYCHCLNCVLLLLLFIVTPPPPFPPAKFKVICEANKTPWTGLFLRVPCWTWSFWLFGLLFTLTKDKTMMLEIKDPLRKLYIGPPGLCVMLWVPWMLQTDSCYPSTQFSFQHLHPLETHTPLQHPDHRKTCRIEIINDA